MATVVRTKTFVDGSVLSAADLNDEFDNCLNALALVNADISGSAAIAVSKINTGLSGSLVGTSDTQTLTNKRMTRRINVASDATSISGNCDNEDMATQVNTQGAGTLTINNLSGTPTNGQGYVFRIKSTNAQTYSFGANFKGGTIPLPTSHAGSSKYDYIGFMYNSTSSTWDLVAVAQAVG